MITGIVIDGKGKLSHTDTRAELLKCGKGEKTN
jgi:hypothetical protein